MLHMQINERPKDSQSVRRPGAGGREIKVAQAVGHGAGLAIADHGIINADNGCGIAGGAGNEGLAGALGLFHRKPPLDDGDARRLGDGKQ